MTTAIIGTGGIGSAIARRLASGGETLRLSSVDRESAGRLAARIGCDATLAMDNRDALQDAAAVVLALRFTVLQVVIDEIADRLSDMLVTVPSKPVGLDAQGNVERLLPGKSPVRSWQDGYRPERAWRWRLEACRRVSSTHPVTGHPSRRSSSTRRMTTVRASKSSG